MTLAFLSQWDGGPYASLNCNATCGAMAVSFETGGAKHPTGSEFRSHVQLLGPDGRGNGIPDRTGGTYGAQIAETAKRAYGVILDARTMPFEDAYRLGTSPEFAIGFSISYAPVAPTRFDGSPGFTGNHQVIRSNAKEYDPLANGRLSHGIRVPNGPQTWPKSLLRTAAGRLNIAGPGDIERGILYRPLGEGRALVVIAQAPATKPKRYSAVFEPGDFWVYSRVTVGSNQGWTRHRDRFPRKTSAPSRPPELIPWLTARKRVVRISAGRLEGLYVEPGSTHVSLKVAA